MRDRPQTTVERRRVLIGAGVALAVTGCLGDDTVEPATLDANGDCDQCGMIVGDHPGPVGQIHFAEAGPEDGRHARFCSASCAYTYRFDADDSGYEPLATFLTDYSRVDQEVFEEGDDVLFSSHLDADAFGRLAELTVVARSDVVGAMGPDLIPFGDADDVEAFAEQYGGEPIAATDVDRTTLEGL